MSQQSCTSPIEEAMQLAQIQLSKSNRKCSLEDGNHDIIDATSKNKTMHQQEQHQECGDTTITMEPAGHPYQQQHQYQYHHQQQEYQQHVHQFQNYYNPHQPKNEIPYSDWSQLFPDLDLIHGSFRTVIVDHSSTEREKQKDRGTMEDIQNEFNSDSSISKTEIKAKNNDNNTSLQGLPDEFMEIVASRNKLKKILIDKLLYGEEEDGK